MSSILLIQPPIKNFSVSPYPPLGLAYLGAVLEQNGHGVRIVDMPLLDIKAKDLDFLKDESLSIVGITSMSENYSSAIEVAKKIKMISPNTFIVLGGPHVTFTDVDTLKRNKEVDAVVRGEGEYTFLDLVEKRGKCSDLSAIPGLSYRKGCQIHSNPNRKYANDLDKYPFPARHLLDIKKYLEKTGSMTILTSRGCPFSCIFCSASEFWNHEQRCRSINNVFDELIHIKNKWNANHITFVDDVFTFNQERTLELCNKMLAKQLKFAWNCTTRTDCVSRKLLTNMKKPGCERIAYGIESADDTVLKKINKKSSIGQMKRVIKETKSLGIEIKLNFIFGFPWESEESISQTIEFIQSMEPDELSINSLVLYPGTEISKKHFHRTGSNYKNYDPLRSDAPNNTIPPEFIENSLSAFIPEYGLKVSDTVGYALKKKK